MTAGATHHFALVPQNFLVPGQTADYCHTGIWSGKAMEDARRYGHVHIACNGEADNFASVPAELSYSSAPRYVHYTSNETIYGTQWREPPAGAPAPLVCDASSDIFSRPLPLANHAMVYAGAQKNLGPSGISLVIARRDFIASGSKDLPALYQYRTYETERSMHNTPNTFGIWMIAEVCAWIKAQGGLAAMAEKNQHKAKLVYDALDHSKAWKPHARHGSRSDMNITWRGATKELEEELIARAEQRGMSGLRGHRSVGGMRASLYNAFPEEGVKRLVELLRELDR
jgi:phosphoserine aminotransferase